MNVRNDWPSGKQAVRFMLDGEVVQVTVDWTYIRSIARRATKNKTGASTMGPVTARVVKR